MLHNVDVRRLVVGLGGVTLGEWLLGTALAVQAYAVGGAFLVGLVGFRFAPAALAGLVTAQLADTHRRDRVLTATALTRAVASGLAAGSLALQLPFVVPLLLVWVDAMVGSAYRPAQAALLPAVVRTPADLTAATAAVSNAKSLSQFSGALAGGLLVASAPSEIAVSVATALYLASALATAGMRTVARSTVAGRLGLRGRLRRMRDGAEVLRGDREGQQIVAYAGLRALVRGLWISLGVVAALRLLGLGKSGFGLLMAAATVGVLGAIPLSALLAGRRLARWLAAGLLLSGAPIMAIGVIAAGVPSIALMVAWGVGMTISDAAGQALLNRVIPVASIGSVTGFMESGKFLLEGAGSLVAPLLVTTLGIREALISAGAVVIVLVAAGARSFARIDARAVGRTEILELLTGVRFFRHLRVEALEGVAAQLQPLAVHAGTEVITQGARDEDRWYLVERGELDVYVEGFLVNELARGDGFGELALIRNASRAATVRARTDVELLSLGRAGFLAAVAGPDIRLSPDIDAVGPGTEDHTDLLRGTLLLGGIDRRALQPMVRVAVLHEVDSGNPIVIEDQLDDRYYVLVSGRATVMVGAERRLVLLPGDGFGEIAVLHQVPRAASVLAEEPCRLLSVPGEEVRAVARERGGLLGKLADGVVGSGARSLPPS